MTTINALCPWHGEVSCAAHDISLYVRRDLELRIPSRARTASSAWTSPPAGAT